VRRLLPFALLGLLALTLIPGIAAVEALDVREARDAQVVRESAIAPEWLTPVFGHDPFFEKPLLGYLPELLASRVLPHLVGGADGPLTDVALSRAVRAAIAIALALLVATIGTRAFGPRAGWLGACALASTFGLPLAARTDGAILLATLCSWLAIGLLLERLQGRGRRRGLTRYAAWLALGVAGLTGGPLMALWPVAGLALYFALARSHAGWREVRPIGGLAIVLGLTLPWYGLMAALYGPSFLSRVACFPYAIGTRASWYTGPLLALSFPMAMGFPWSPMLAAALRDAASRLRHAGAEAGLQESGHAASLLLALLVAAGVPVLCFPDPPLTAALPTVPALALLCGRFVDRVLDGDVDARLLAASARVTAVLGTVIALLIALVATRIAAAAPGLRLLGAALFATSWTPLLADLAGRRKLAAALFALPVALCTPLMTTQVLPALEPWLNTRDVAEGMMAAAPPRAPLALIEPAPPSLRLLLPRNLVQLPALDARLATLAARDGNAYLAFPPAREHDVARTSPAPLEILLRTPTLVLARVRVGSPIPTP